MTAAGHRRGGTAVCADIGSTYTKVAVVGLADGRLLATAEHPSTVETDIRHGLDAAVAAAGADRDAPWFVCSSAGGGLRLAVVGQERLVSAEAGYRVALSAGARTVHVSAGALDTAGAADLHEAEPDVVLLVGGTDGGESDTIRHNAARLAAAGLRVPVVVAGNAEARAEVMAALSARQVPARAAANVLPRIGQLQPAPARAVIREVFLRHVIGGKRLCAGDRLAGVLRAATPDAVLRAVELLAEHDGTQLLVVDVGGATTDVYSALAADPRRTPQVAGTLWRARTVEGDLGVRWGAPAVVQAATAERLLDAGEIGPLSEAAHRRAATAGVLADTGPERAHDLRLAGLAATVALRRHARGEPAGAAAGNDQGEGGGGRASSGRDLRGVRLVVGSGGVLRHTPSAAATAVLAAAVGDHAGGWPVPRRPDIVIDSRYVLAAGGLLAAEHPRAAAALLRRHLEEG